MALGMNEIDNCIFCETKNTGRVIDQSELSFVIRDAFPVTNGHTLIIPKRHVADYFDLTSTEMSDVQHLLRKHRDQLIAEDNSVEGFNVGINIGQAAGQTVFHVHIHLIPRRKKDVKEPRGGVRGVIPEKQAY